MIDGWGRQKGVLVLKSTDKLIKNWREEKGDLTKINPLKLFSRRCNCFFFGPFFIDLSIKFA